MNYFEFIPIQLQNNYYNYYVRSALIFYLKERLNSSKLQLFFRLILYLSSFLAAPLLAAASCCSPLLQLNTQQNVLFFVF